MLPAGHETEEEQATVGAWDEYNPYGRSAATLGDQARRSLSDVMVMQASACKRAVADPRQVEAWFTECEPQLEEDVDFPWWPQLLPLMVGQDKVADNNARKLTC